MSHLTPDQYSGLLDYLLERRDRERVERHLAECAACRTTLASLESQERGLARALDHDPGEAYFESFADRLRDRLRAESLAGAQRRQCGRLAALFMSPRRLAVVGTLVAVVVGAGVVLMTVKETEFPQLRPGGPPARRAPMPVVEESAPAPEAASGLGGAQAPAAPEAAPASPPLRAKAHGRASVHEAAPPRAQQDAGSAPQGAGSPATLKAPATTAAPMRPSRLVEVRRNAAGEDVPVRPPELQRFRQTAPQPPPAPAEGPTYVRKTVRAEPMRTLPQSEPGAPAAPSLAPAPEAQGTAKTEALAPQRAADEQAAATARLCGDVRDPLGRPVPGAQVALRETGASATADTKGHFCLDAPAGLQTLTVMAVGYRDAEVSVKLGGEESYAAVEITPVSPTPAWGSTRSLYRGGGERAGSPAAGFAKPPGSLSDLQVRGGLAPTTPAGSALAEARRLSSIADRARTAGAREAAAAAWDRAAQQLPEGAAQRDARFQAARERVEAWRLSRRVLGWSASGELQARRAATASVRGAIAGESDARRRAQLADWLRALER